MSTVIYVAIVEGDQDRGYSAFFPDLPGCVTAAETMVELPAAARDALSLHLQGMAEDGDAFPEPTALEDIKSDPEVKEVGRVLVDADVEDAPVRVNISIGAQFLKRIDVAAESRGMSRSGFLVEAARAMLGGARGDVHEAQSETGMLLLSAHDKTSEWAPLLCTAADRTLHAHMCKWPISDPSSSGFGFCGRRSEEGAIYCVEHANKVNEPHYFYAHIAMPSEGMAGGFPSGKKLKYSRQFGGRAVVGKVRVQEIGSAAKRR